MAFHGPSGPLGAPRDHHHHRAVRAVQGVDGGHRHARAPRREPPKRVVDGVEAGRGDRGRRATGGSRHEQRRVLGVEAVKLVQARVHGGVVLRHELRPNGLRGGEGGGRLGDRRGDRRGDGAEAGAGDGAGTSRSRTRSGAGGDLVRGGAGHPRGGRHRDRRGVTAGHQSSNRAAGRIRLCGGALRRDARSPREGCETREKGYSLFRVSRLPGSRRSVTRGVPPVHY